MVNAFVWWHLYLGSGVRLLRDGSALCLCLQSGYNVHFVKSTICVLSMGVLYCMYSALILQ